MSAVVLCQAGTGINFMWLNMQHSKSGTMYGTTWHFTCRVHMLNTTLVPRP